MFVRIIYNNIKIKVRYNTNNNNSNNIITYNII